MRVDIRPESPGARINNLFAQRPLHHVDLAPAEAWGSRNVRLPRSVGPPVRSVFGNMDSAATVY